MFAKVAEPDFIRGEHEVLRFWREHAVFAKLREKNARSEKQWSFLDGPITANNPMGVHHAWGRTYKDVFQRFFAMTGHRQRFQNGFDCQGLWVEVEVEKELKLGTKTAIVEFGIDRFVNECKKRVLRFAARQTEQSIRLGYWMDWDNSYYTNSDENNYTIWGFLKTCWERGYVYKGHDVMPWCPRCATGLSEHEIVTEGYREVTHASVYLKFPLVDRPGESLLVEREAMDRQRVRASRRLEVDVDASIEVFRGGAVDQPSPRSVGLDAHFVLARSGPRPHPGRPGSPCLIDRDLVSDDPRLTVVDGGRAAGQPETASHGGEEHDLIALPRTLVSPGRSRWQLIERHSHRLILAQTSTADRRAWLSRLACGGRR